MTEQDDNIGNRRSRTEGAGATLYYCANNLNQYTATDDAAGCPETWMR